MNKFKIYLCGKMSGLSFEEMNEWRMKASRLLKSYKDYTNIHTINPCDFYNFEIDQSSFTEKEVKIFDLNMVKQSNILLFNKNYPNSIGTAIELQKAEDWGIPVIAYGITINHPWIELCITKNCKTLEAAVQHIIDFYYLNF